MPPDTSKTAPTPSAAGSAAAEVGNLVRDLAPVFDALFLPHAHIVLAVSGGPDSMALMHLVSQWRSGRASAPAISVATVDHQLRADSAAEAAMVAQEAQRLSLPHTTLPWPGAKPATGLQAAAREARRALLQGHLTAIGSTAVAMAHTADDQAETVLMRLARGSGADGLAAMRDVTPFGDGRVLVRPLLGVTKERLLRALPSWACRWAEDPSNRSQAFERVRIRQARIALRDNGLDFDSKSLGRVATRQARASDALHAMTARAWSERSPQTELYPHGWAELDWAWLLEHPEEIRLRLLTGLLEAVGGMRPASLGQLEGHTIGRSWQPGHGTLNGVQMRERVRRVGVEGTRPVVVLTPELDARREAPVSSLPPPGESLLWDGRFLVTTPARELPVGLHIAPLGAAATRDIDAHWLPLRPQPATAALYRLPAIWRGPRLAAVPALGYLAPDATGDGLADVTTALLQPAFAHLPHASSTRR